MGWPLDAKDFSNALFGKRKTLDPNRVNSYMEPYDKMVQEQTDMSRQMMDPNSVINRQRQDMMREQSMDAIASQNQGLMGMAAMSGISPGQAGMQAQQNMAAGRGQMGQQFGNMLQNQQNQGLSLFSQAMSGQQGIGERQAQMYMEGINAHNMRRQQYQQMAAQVAGAALGMGSSFMKPGGMG